MKQIQLSHGGGGEETQGLIHALFYRYFENDLLLAAEDAAVIEVAQPMAFTTDSFTVSPLFFQGGNIGKLAIAGTVNDLAMMGARPRYLSASFIIEEGFSVDSLEKIVKSMAEELSVSGAQIVCGDTKVVPKGAADQLFINTTGIGEVMQAGLSANALQEGDLIIVSGDVGRHGTAILLGRDGLGVSGSVESDCATLWPAVEMLLNSTHLRAMRDATRGGLSAVLNEWARQSNICIEVDEIKVPIDAQVRGLCELFGFDAFDLANEGTMVIALPAKYAEDAIKLLQGFEATANAAVIGRVSHEKDGRVILHASHGSRRYLDLPKGELLPRIC